MPTDNRNFIVFIVLTLVLMGGYEYFVAGPQQKRHEAEQAQAAAAARAAQKAGVTLAPDGQPVVTYLSRAQALAATPRIALRTPSLTGSISLKGARIDDLFLCGTDAKSPPCYRQTVAANSPPQELLRPVGAENAYYVVNGWSGTDRQGLTDENTLWTATSTGPLTQQHPIDLTYASPQGLVFHRRIAVDASYLFTITDQVTNQGAAPVILSPYGIAKRLGVPADAGKTATEGAIGMLDKKLQEVKYPKWKKDGTDPFSTTGGWMGITDKYWMTAFIPDQSELLNVEFKAEPEGGVDTYATTYTGAARPLAPGATITEVTHIFAGAKVAKTLAAYSAALHLPNFDKAVGWGNFEVIIKPLFEILNFYAGLVGNFGLAILALTLTIRIGLFPVFNASYAMSTKMKKVQPELKALQERHKNDAQAQQKEMMALYAREKINPVTGCVPMLLPLPIFYALITMFRVTIEMRHASFGWIQDLSAPDPTTIWNLFGLIPWDPFSNAVVLALTGLPFVGGLVGMVFHLGAWPIIYAVTMWLSQITGPPMTGVDPMQQKMIRWMPWVFMFLFAQYAVGLVIYWSFSSVFTFGQQYVLMRRFKVDNPIDDFLTRLTAHKKK